MALMIGEEVAFTLIFIQNLTIDNGLEIPVHFTMLLWFYMCT